MAERRMFAKTIIDSDAFLDMPLSTQALYFHLSMRADDDGFINNPKKIQRMTGCADDDLKLLITKNFIIPFESGIVVIKHWKIHNYIRNDRYKETVYKEEMALLEVKNNKAYTLGIPSDNHAVYQMETQVRLGKDRIELGKESIGEDIAVSDETEPPTPEKKSKPVKHKYGEYKNVLLTDDELQKLKTEYSDYEERIESLSSYVASTGKKYKSHYATIRRWAKEDAEKPQAQKKASKFHNFNQRDYDYEAMEQMLLKQQNPPKTAAEDENIRQRAEALKKEFGGV